MGLLTRDTLALVASRTRVAAAEELRVEPRTLYAWLRGGWLSGGGR